MAGLIAEIVCKAIISAIIVLIAGTVFPAIFELGDGFLQSHVVLSFYVYCFIVLFTSSPDKLFHVLSIPFFTQFIHIFQRYSFPAGANSLWRLFPFFEIILYLTLFLACRPTTSTKTQKYFAAAWLLVQGFFLIRSPQLEVIIGGGITVYLLTIPLYFLYVQNLSLAVDFGSQLEKYLFLLFVILGLGTFGLIYTGAAYVGSDNLLVTRNIADTNVTMVYFILLWPFSLLYALSQRNQTPLLFSIFFVFAAIIFFSFSRGAVIIGVPYLIISLLCLGRRSWIVLVLLTVLTQNTFFRKIVSDLQLDYSWSLRFADIQTLDSFWGKLQATSGRAEIQSKAWELFIEQPFFGHGTGSFEYLGPGFREAHSLYYTLLAENGSIGALYIYGLFSFLLIHLLQRYRSLPHFLIPASLIFYLIFNHTIGSVFVILPAKSISVNCIAPVLLICLYFHKNGVGKLPGARENRIKTQKNIRSCHEA